MPFLKEYYITASARDEGGILPQGLAKVEEGSSQNFIIGIYYYQINLRDTKRNYQGYVVLIR